MEKNTISFLEKVKLQISALKARKINEAQTKEWLIKPFFESLSWNFSNPFEIVPEDEDPGGKKPDYCFNINKVPKLLVEAKQLLDPLHDKKMIMEKLNYCSNSGVPLLIITNGDLYKIYYAEMKGVGADKLLKEFSIFGTIDEELIARLTKKAFETDELLKYAKNISLLTNIKKAVENLFQSPDKKFISLINETVKETLGHKFGDDEIEYSLKQFSLNISSDFYDTGIEKEDVTEAGGVKWRVSNQFNDGKWGMSYDLYNKLIKELQKMGVEFKENPTKFYIGLISGTGKNFCQIHGQKSGLKLWLNLELSDLSEEETLKVRDVSKIGRWGMGTLECNVSNLPDIEWATNFIKKAYQRAK